MAMQLESRVCCQDGLPATSKKENCVLSVGYFLPHIESIPLSALYATLSLAQPCRRGMASSVRWSSSPHFVVLDLLVLVYRRKWRDGNIEATERKQ